MITLTRSQLAPILVGLLLGTLMTSLSQLIVATALPVVIAALGGMELYSWAFAAALLTSTIVVPIAGKLSDLYGRKTLYLIGMAIFLAGSALAGTAQTIQQLILFRALQGAGAGCVSPSVSALIADLFPPEQRGRWQGINGAIWGLSSVVGPILGGYLAEHVSWRWVFWVNLIPGVLAAAIMVKFLPWSIRRASPPKVDYLGMMWLSSVLLILMLLTIVGGAAFPWESPQTIAFIGIVVACAVAFVAQERRAEEPIVPLELFRNRTYQTVVILVLLTGAGLFGAITYVPLYLQAVLNVSPTATGLLFAPTVVAMTAMSVIAGIFMHRIGYRILTFLTLAAGAIGFAVMSVIDPARGTFPVVLGLSIIGSGIGLSFPVFIVIAQNAVDRAVVGIATSVVQLTRSLGGTVGVTLLGAYMTARLADVLITGAGGQSDLAALLRPESLATLTPAQIGGLRTELADAIRALFAAGAVAMTFAAVFSWRLENLPTVPAGRMGFFRRR
ncbi:MAG TPA: MDR family MFS transporter [Chloroflexota bacterium]|nr:MDR family MFS transporter [Chloroflexota bacterium]